MCVTHVQNFLDSNFNLAVIDKISNFHEIAQNSTYLNKSLYFMYICNFLDLLLHPYKFRGKDMSGIHFFYFCQLWAVKDWHQHLRICHTHLRLKITVRAAWSFRGPQIWRKRYLFIISNFTIIYTPIGISVSSN